MDDTLHAPNRRVPRFFAVLTVAAGLTAAVPAHAGQPYQARIKVTIPAGQPGECVPFTVPTGNRLTIEFLSLLIHATASGEQMNGAALYASIDGQPETASILPITSLGTNSFQGAQTLKAYADPGSNLRFCLTRSTTTGILDVYGSLAGTLDAL